MAIQGEGFNLGAKRSKNTKPRKPKSNLLPPETSIPTEPIIQNIESLNDVSFKPMFSEMMERGRGDYGAFASDFLDVQLHAGQLRWLHSHSWSNERMLSAANRWGKTASAGVKALHDCFFQTRPPQYAQLTSEYRYLNLSLTLEMSRIAWDYALKYALSSKIFRRFVLENEIKTAPFPTMPIGTPKSQRDNAYRSEYWARSSSKGAKFILGLNFDVINYDECARDPNGATVLDEVLRMRVTDRNGRIDLPSTAAGKNWFFLQCMRANTDPEHLFYYYTTGNSFENPFISHDRVRQNEKVMSKAWIEQNVYGGFAEYSNTFARPQIEAMYLDVDYPICTDFSKLEYMTVDPQGQYIMAIDWGLKRDATVIMVARADPNRWENFKDSVGEPTSFGHSSPIVFAQGFTVKPTGERYSWQELKNIAVMIHKRFNSAPCLFDSTGMAGEMIFDDLRVLGMTDHDGYDFSGNQGQQKDMLIIVAQQALQSRAFVFPLNTETNTLVEQLLLYERQDKNLDTDYVFAFCLLAERLRRANLPISEILSLPLIFASGSRRLGTGHPFDRDAYSINTVNSRPRVNYLKDSNILIVSNGNYAKEEVVA